MVSLFEADGTLVVQAGLGLCAPRATAIAAPTPPRLWVMFSSVFLIPPGISTVLETKWEQLHFLFTCFPRRLKSLWKSKSEPLHSTSWTVSHFSALTFRSCEILFYSQFCPPPLPLCELSESPPPPLKGMYNLIFILKIKCAVLITGETVMRSGDLRVGAGGTFRRLKCIDVFCVCVCWDVWGIVFLSRKSPHTCFFLKDVKGFLCFSRQWRGILDPTEALQTDLQVSLLSKMLLRPHN